jgi:endonuclease/exonuclease/phosphatase family metal-dependent hydrolase
VRIVTINTAKGDGQYAYRVESLARQLRELDADVVLLQEALSTCDRTLATASFLGDRLMMEVTASPARRKLRSVDGREVLCDSGLAILTRQPPLDSTVQALPSLRADGERIAQIVLADHPAGPLLVVNLHLTHLRDAADLRRAQLDTILGHPWLHGQAVARLLCGDFNATLDAPELASLVDGLRGWDVRDAYQAGSGATPRHTIHPDVSLHGGSTVARCIDYIFSLATNPADQPAFTNSAIVLNRPDSVLGVYPSDHFGVTTTMSLEAPSDGSSAHG